MSYDSHLASKNETIKLHRNKEQTPCLTLVCNKKGPRQHPQITSLGPSQTNWSFFILLHQQTNGSIVFDLVYNIPYMIKITTERKKKLVWGNGQSGCVFLFSVCVCVSLSSGRIILLFPFGIFSVVVLPELDLLFVSCVCERVGWSQTRPVSTFFPSFTIIYPS